MTGSDQFLGEEIELLKVVAGKKGFGLPLVSGSGVVIVLAVNLLCAGSGPELFYA